MKKYKKLLLLMVCTGVIGSMTACGNRNNDNGADQTGTDGIGNNSMNDATGGNNNGTTGNNGSTNTNNSSNTSNKNNGTNGSTGTERDNGTINNNGTGRNDGDGVIDDAIDDVRDGIDDMTDDNNVNDTNNR